MLKYINNILSKYIPDPFVIALLLTIYIYILALVITPSTSFQIITYWGDNYWSLIPFTMQMSMMLLFGYVIAISSYIQKFISKIAEYGNTQIKSIIICTLLGACASMINWGFGLIISGFICKQLIKRWNNLNYPLLVASSYSGFLFWHGGLSGSIPLVIATEYNFLYDDIGGIIGLDNSIFSILNIFIIVVLLVSLLILNIIMSIYSKKQKVTLEKEKKDLENTDTKKDIIYYLESTGILTWCLFIFSLYYLYSEYYQGHYNIDLNKINFLLFFFGLLVHKTPRNLLKAVTLGVSKIWPILIQYPFYSGIMGIMNKTGLAMVISSFFLQISSPSNFCTFSFISAGIVNFFIPSGGGQWVIQGPTVINTAQYLGIPVQKVAIAIAWGDAWTNMAQPFWAIPLLLIAGLGIKDIIGYCLLILLVSGFILSFIFFLF